MSANRTLDFFVIGAQKCATSWLYYCLREHPQLCLSHKKSEENYYGGALHRERGDDWFYGLYQPEPERWRSRGSVSVDYLFDGAALRNALAEFPQARFVACLRNPYERTASAYQFLSRRGLLPGDAFAASLERGLADYHAGDDTAFSELVTRSLYGHQLGPFMDGGLHERLLLVGYDELCQHPQACLHGLYEFLGVDSTFLPPSLASRPKQNANIPWLNRLERSAPNSKLMGKVMDHLNQWLCRAGLNRPSAAYPPGLKTQLAAVINPDLQVLDRLTQQLPVAQRIVGHSLTARWR